MDPLDELRQAILQQAVRDGVIEWYYKTPEFAQLFPELSPEYIERRLVKDAGA